MIDRGQSYRAGRGFSLVELIIAIGVTVFCVITIVGLLPVGLKTIKNSREEIGAAQCLDLLSQSLHSATPTDTGGWRILGVYSNLSWTSPNLLTNISIGGMPTSMPAGQRLVARVEILSAPQTNAPGTALISIAWPNTAGWVGGGDARWTNAQGSVTSWITFLPYP